MAENKSQQATNSKGIVKEKVRPAASMGIVDRGIKLNYENMVSEVKRWRSLCLVLAVACGLSATNFTFAWFGLKPKIYAQSTHGEFVQLEELRLIPIDDLRMANFTNEAVPSILKLNHSTVNDQLQRARIYFTPGAYTNIMNELNRSNYVKNIIENKIIVDMTPLNDYFVTKYSRTKDGMPLALAERGYLVIEKSGNEIMRRYFVVRIVAEGTTNYKDHPWGIAIRDFSMERFVSTQEYEAYVKSKLAEK